MSFKAGLEGWHCSYLFVVEYFNKMLAFLEITMEYVTFQVIPDNPFPVKFIIYHVLLWVTKCIVACLNLS